MAPPRKSRLWLWLLLAGGGFFFLILVCAGGFGWLLIKGHAEIEPIAEAFQAKVDAADYSGAYQSIGPEWKAVDSEEKFTSFESSVRKQLGVMLSKSTASFNVQDGVGQGSATITYNANYEKGPASVTYTLSKRGGAWLVIGHNVDSPLLTQLVTCPKCGHVANVWSDFCGECGAKMDR